ncbi:MAG: gliding motility lipoprotein GldH [Cyclobacteriaceae bacterium]|nr:gliding motility lipoprotein GldH [Cyclobacteriaceae bacterium]
MNLVRSYLHLFLFCGLAALTSCSDNRVFEDNTEFDDRTWKVTDEPRYTFAITDTALKYNLYYNVRNSLDYPYARIFITYHLYDSTGRELSKKLVYNDLFDQKAGKPFGDSGLGDLYDHQFPILNNYSFPHPGKYSMKLDQFMRQDTLQGVLAVGVRVERVP